jgi:murein DD-endopeptidase MepM/ murein hydrolase activator NlpD
MKKRVLQCLLATVLTGSMMLGTVNQVLRVTATSTSSESKDDKDEEDDDDAYTKELEDKKQDTINEIKSLKSDISTVEEKISDLKNTKSNLQSYITQLDAQVNQLSSQMAELEKEIEAKKEEIEAKKEELAEAEAEAEEQYDLMKKRIRYMYEQGDQSFLVLLLESDSIADLMNRAEYAVQMSSYDRQMMEEMKAAREEIKAQQEQLEAEEAEQEELLAEVESQKNAVNKAIDAKTQEIASYQEQITSAAGDQAEYEKQLEEQEKLLEKVEAQIAAAAAAKAAASDGDGGSSGFIWPSASSKRITSSFGPRTAPVAGASTNHKGIDIGASSGSAILAAAAGRVTTATYSSSAGNYVVISHGNGISTVYMHASALYVSEGQTVSQGQTIAAVGSTGFSTGPHLHFGVIVNGSYVNPLNYVK